MFLRQNIQTTSLSTCGVVVTTLAFQAGDPGSILGRTSTQYLKTIAEKVLYLYISIGKGLAFRVFSDKDVKIVATSNPISIGQ